MPQLELASIHYLDALSLHPLDPALWFELAITLERQGREAEYLERVKPVAERVTHSAAIDAWFERGAEGSAELQQLRQAFASDMALMYLGFAGETRVAELERELASLGEERADVARELESLEAERETLERERADALAAGPANEEPEVEAEPEPALDPDPDADAESLALAPVSAPPPGDEVATISRTDRIVELAARIAQLRETETQLDDRIRARSSAFPLFTSALATAPLTRELAVRRTHPAHALLRRLYREAEGRLQ